MKPLSLRPRNVATWFSSQCELDTTSKSLSFLSEEDNLAMRERGTFPRVTSGGWARCNVHLYKTLTETQ
ncbi:hypothetical protein KI387_003708, partial [Taxus chinensis]